ncbi:MAG: hypothetical protein H6733_13075, partial [Alphaproteobacteria bacterium]|nr:hypothetical protein [Alphaproteobacteria bacterium]
MAVTGSGPPVGMVLRWLLDPAHVAYSVPLALVTLAASVFVGWSVRQGSAQRRLLAALARRRDFEVGIVDDQARVAQGEVRGVSVQVEVVDGDGDDVTSAKQLLPLLANPMTIVFVPLALVPFAAWRLVKTWTVAGAVAPTLVVRATGAAIGVEAVARAGAHGGWTTGDDAFDAEVALGGDTHELYRFLHAPERHAASQIVQLGGRLVDGDVVLQASVADGQELDLLVDRAVALCQALYAEQRTDRDLVQLAMSDAPAPVRSRALRALLG